MATSEGIPSSIDIEFLELNDNPYLVRGQAHGSHHNENIGCDGQQANPK